MNVHWTHQRCYNGKQSASCSMIDLNLCSSSSHNSIRRLESFTKDALSITKMIEERERMMSHRSRSIDSVHSRSRRTSIDPVPMRSRYNDADDDADDDDFNESDSSVTRILKRRMRKKKKQPTPNPSNESPPVVDEKETVNFDNLRRRLSR